MNGDHTDAPGPGAGDEDHEEPPASLTGTVLRGVSLAGTGFALAQALTLAVYLILARLVTPDEFGTFAAATAIYGFALVFTESGMMAAIIHRRSRLAEAIATATLATLAGGILFSLIGLATAPLVGAFFDSTTVAEVAAVSSGLVFLRTAGCVPEAIFQREFSFMRRLVVEPAQVIFFGAASIIAASAGMGVWSLVIGQYTGYAAEALLSWVLLRTPVRLRLASFSMWRELAGYGRHVLASTAVQHAGAQSDAIVVGKLIGTAALGQFRYALRIASTPVQLLVAGAAYVLFPAFARIAHDLPRLQHAYLRSLGWLSVLAFPAGLVLIPLGVPMAVIFFGEPWRPAGEVAMALSVYAACSSLITLASESFKATGRPDVLPRLNITVAISSALLMLACAPFGLVAIGIGFSLGTLVGILYSLLLCRRLLAIPIRSMVAAMWAPALAATVMAAAVLPLDVFVFDSASRGTLVGLGLIATEAVICGLVYVAVLGLLSPRLVRQMFNAARIGAGRLRLRLPAQDVSS